MKALDQMRRSSQLNRYAMEKKSSIIAIGLSVHQTPVDVREQLAIAEAEWPRAIAELVAYPHIEEAAVLSTCNRMELYVVALSRNRGIREVEEWMSRSSGLALQNLMPHLFCYTDRDATEHLLRVAGGCKEVVILNRSMPRAEALAAEFPEVDSDLRLMPELMRSVAEADVVFAASSSEEILVRAQDLQSMPPASDAVGNVRRFFDIAVPRNLASDINDAPSSRVFNVDDLKEVVAANKEGRRQAAAEAEVLLRQEQLAFEAWRDSLETVPTIKALRSKAEAIRAAELDKVLSKFGEGMSKKQVRAIEELSRGIVNKLLHGPMTALRCDGSDPNAVGETLANMDALERMFELSRFELPAGARRR
ncbi:hypothetical protein WJX73_010533 [Symbiochloris irregularis]|uniref:Glutamyl-tRNA reductase n=1 Tax=Symbiochloris irregularis TaxID=706552 RepID=A0AAW1NPV0_9CHLO